MVADAWWLGQPDDPARTRVIDVFDQPVRCAEISAPGWDKTVADASQVLEIKLVGTQPGRYALAANGRPATGEADVNYTLTSTSGTPSEVPAKSGFVKLDSITNRGAADGSFDLTFADGNVAGSFHAVYCPGGSEP